MEHGSGPRLARVIAQRLAHAVCLLALVLLGTVLLLRVAPGYFDDAREMDAAHPATNQVRIAGEQERAGSLAHLLAAQAGRVLRGDLGQSRQYGVPVKELLAARSRTSASLLLRGIGFGWLLAVVTAVLANAARRGGWWIAFPFTVLLALPAGAMAAVALHANMGGPALVLSLLVAARDFKFLERTLREAFATPYLLHARALGLRWPQRLRAHVLPAVLPQLRALAVMSLVLALSALVPVEVLFDTPGVGQLAWNAALNRDLPVLLAVTLLMAAMVTATGLAARNGDARNGDARGGDPGSGEARAFALVELT